ncbi:RNA-binding protein with multiple splicing 2 [Homalodisca vitripennis]|nr:RNA-binding protein with multiple splicing 2 [Homalodisca vitripennis]
MPQTIRLEFAKSNTKVSKPKQPVASLTTTHPTLMHPLTGRKYRPPRISFCTPSAGSSKDNQFKQINTRPTDKVPLFVPAQPLVSDYAAFSDYLSNLTQLQLIYNLPHQWCRCLDKSGLRQYGAQKSFMASLGKEGYGKLKGNQKGSLKCSTVITINLGI